MFERESFDSTIILRTVRRREPCPCVDAFLCHVQGLSTQLQILGCSVCAQHHSSPGHTASLHLCNSHFISDRARTVYIRNVVRLFFFFFLCLSQFIASALVTVWMRSAIKVYYLPNFAEPCLDTEWALCSEPFLARNQSTCVLGSGQIPALGARLRSPVFAGHIQFQTDCGCHENTLCIYFGRSHLNNQLLHWLSRSTAVGSCLPGWLPSWEMSQ